MTKYYKYELLIDLMKGSEVFGNVLDADLSVPSTKGRPHEIEGGVGTSGSDFEYEFEQPVENQLGNILEFDFSQSHVSEEPLIKHFEGHQHILTHDMTLSHVRFILRLKSLFAWIFGSKPKRAS